jgi:hypothetical protein
MAEIYEFDPATDIQVLETFTFEEEVDRPENLRFYTLDEQVTDYFERSIPVGKVSKHKMFLLEREADRVRDLYETIVIGTDTSFDVRKERPHDGYLPWITPVYSQDIQRRPIRWATDYMPLLAPRQPRFYDRMLAGLPRPLSFATGKRAAFSKPQRFVDAEGSKPIRAVPIYKKTRGILHAGGKYEIVEDDVPNTGDDIAVRGYWIGKRSLDLVSPLAEHPILGSNDAHFYESAADYTDVVPSVEAIMNHAVPVTPHPFRDATPYLKLYDVEWADIPWTAWKRHFPPAEQVSAGLPVEPIAIPQHNPDIPSESLQKYYHVPFQPGMSPRYWLSCQEDGGILVARMLLSQAGDATPITVPNPVQAPMAPLTPATPLDCLPPGMGFDEFLTKGVYRPPGVCVPLETIAKEKSEFGMRGRLSWGETTHDDVLSGYIPILQASQGPAPDTLKEPVIPKPGVPELSPFRKDVLTILGDENRVDSDKAADLRTLVADMPVKNKQFLDQDEKFLLCEHSLAILSGDLENNRKFYETWCAIVDGSRVCKFCGEAINRDVMVDVVEFDDAGHAVLHSEAPMVAEFHPGGVRTFTSQLQSLRALFDTRDPAQDVFFMLLSILQILPDQARLEPILGQVRQLSNFTKTKGESAQAVYGICGVALLMQTHEPFLIPRRSFGVPFILTGWPREGKDSDAGILDSLLGALKKTFEQFKTTFKGPSMGLVREVFRASGKVREKCILALKIMTKPPPAFIQKLGLTDYTDLLDQAAMRYAKAPPVPAQLSVLVPNIRIDTGDSAKTGRTECIPSAHVSFWSTSTPALLLQSPIVFTKNATPGVLAAQVGSTSSTQVTWSPLPSDTAARLKKELPAFAKALRNLQLVSTLSDRSISWTQSAAIAGRLLDLARTRTVGLPSQLLRQLRGELESLDPSQNASQLRDAARGIAYATLDAVSKIPALREQWSEILPKDLALKSLTRTSAALEGEVRSLITAERESFKTRLGEKSDMERELVKQLLDIGLAPYVITLQDRQLFAQQLEERVRPDPLGNPEVPEEGFQEVPTDAERDDAAQGERGDFGDMPSRPYGADDEYADFSTDIGV